ncbi:MAG: hypothetical protein KAI66_00670 [Lentisphaeria bacterium]|nr:hypothetical protein [Lentisphaeria bacterium]
MKRLAIVTTLSFVLGAVACAAGKPEDGYALYVQACEHSKSLGVERYSPVWEELREFCENGGAPSSSVLKFVQREEKAFSLIAAAHGAQSWKLPDMSEQSAQTGDAHLPSWRIINRTALVSAVMLYTNGKPEDCLTFLSRFHDVGLRVSKTGTVIHMLVHAACRFRQYSVLVSAIDKLPETLLGEQFRRAMEQYARIPTVNEWMIGERYMAINAVKDFFVELREQEDVMASRKRMIQVLKDHGADRKALQRIERGESLSVSQWETQVLSDLEKLQSFYTKALTMRPSNELTQMDDEIAKRIEDTGDKKKYDISIASWYLFIAKHSSDPFSIADAERLHSQVGKMISRQLLGLLTPAAGAIGIRYREFVALERLLLIRLAARLYRTKHREGPSTLQQLVDDNLLEAEMIIDPLSGKTFLAKEGKALEPYSVGRDLEDDKGLPLNARTGDAILVPLEEKWNVQDPRASVRD